MPTFLPAKEGFMDGSVQLITPVIKAALVRGYTQNRAHRFVSQITTAGGSIVGTPITLTSKTVIDGVFRAADSTWTGIAAGTAIPGFLIYQASAVTGGADLAATAQRVIYYGSNAAGLPLTPNGQDISSDWPDADDPNGIFAL